MLSATSRHDERVSCTAYGERGERQDLLFLCIHQKAPRLRQSAATR